MARQPFISHAVNGYSRYDVPENKAFSCTPGILYPVRIDFINARDRVTLSQGIDVRSNPLAVPTFNPYVVRLHRFWVPMQLYHPDMRVNSANFDMNNLSLNFLPTSWSLDISQASAGVAYSNSLMFWLRIGNKSYVRGTMSSISEPSLDPSLEPGQWLNADTYLAYWDIVRNFYGYSQWSLFSIAWPGSWSLKYTNISDGVRQFDFSFGSRKTFFTQDYCALSFLDSYYETQFYPGATSSTNNTFNRANLFAQILMSDINADEGASQGEDGLPVFSVEDYRRSSITGPYPTNAFDIDGVTTGSGLNTLSSTMMIAHPMAVVPSNPDRFSRLVPTTSASDVSMNNITTIPQLAVASRLQEYKDLLGAGGSRFSDWLETFFASKISHVDRPKLLFSASQLVNVQVVINQSGNNNFSTNQPLGQQGGAIAFNSQLGSRQSYYFSEPGYLIDMLSIRPVYYWATITPDYLRYRGSDYFNPLYNDIGYQDVSSSLIFNTRFNVGSPNFTVALEPCFNEFRSSYDEVLGQLSAATSSTSSVPLYSYWVQQRSFGNVTTPSDNQYYRSLFVSMNQVNSPFVSDQEDNFFVNMSYSVIKKNLVNKTFATRLSNR
ncbi:major capsid protein [Dipodfec virus UOA04_Rod_660]|nr:major capsid protein [Dipodfec virus UOA04_Rod_660]